MLTIGQPTGAFGRKLSVERPLLNFTSGEGVADAPGGPRVAALKLYGLGRITAEHLQVLQ